MIRIPKFNNRTDKVFKDRPAGEAPAVLKIVAAGDDAVDLMLDTDIGFFGISAQTFNAALAQVKAGTINLRVNSKGGDVFDGIAMFNALQKHPAKVIAHVEGIAASAASLVVMAADEVRMYQGSFLMIHNVWTGMAGNANEMRELADTLDKIDAQLAGIYAEKSGRKADTMKSFMDDETWFDADEAVANKLADSVEGQPAKKNEFDLSIFNHVPEALVASGKKKTPRELEALLRDEAGLSRSEAKRVAAAAQPPRLRDEDIADLDTVLKSFRSK